MYEKWFGGFKNGHFDKDLENQKKCENVKSQTQEQLAEQSTVSQQTVFKRLRKMLKKQMSNFVHTIQNNVTYVELLLMMIFFENTKWKTSWEDKGAPSTRS